MTKSLEALIADMKAAAEKAKAALDAYASHLISIEELHELTADFHRLTENPGLLLALIAALEQAQQREQRAVKLVMDNDSSWEQLFAQYEAAQQRIAELESLCVNPDAAMRGVGPLCVKLRKHAIGEVMHMSGFDRQYADGWCAGNDNAIHEIRVAGGTVEGGE